MGHFHASLKNTAKIVLEVLQATVNIVVETGTAFGQQLWRLTTFQFTWA